jgi:hypothetical protein
MFQKKVADEIKTHILFSIIFPPESSVFYEITWKNMVQPEGHR